jgi:hypothetical protein
MACLPSDGRKSRAANPSGYPQPRLIHCSNNQMPDRISIAPAGAGIAVTRKRGRKSLENHTIAGHQLLAPFPGELRPDFQRATTAAGSWLH